jgi:hypothetical protein
LYLLFVVVVVSFIIMLWHLCKPSILLACYVLLLWHLSCIFFSFTTTSLVLSSWFFLCGFLFFHYDTCLFF